MGRDEETMDRDLRIECGVREKGFFSKAPYAPSTLRLYTSGARKVLEYAVGSEVEDPVSPSRPGGPPPADGGSQGPAALIRLPLAGMKVKVRKGRVAEASYANIKGTTCFRFEKDEDLTAFLSELVHYPMVFRRFRDFYDIGEKIGEGHTCKVYKVRIFAIFKTGLLVIACASHSND